MADNILTPKFRAAFISIFKARAQKQEDGTMGAAKYSIRAAFPPNADLSQLKREAEAAAVEKWGDKLPKTLRSPFRLNEELDNPVVGIGDDWTIVTFSANDNGPGSRPGIVDSKVQDIIDESEVYSGAWYRAQVRAFAYDKKGNRGVTFGLQNVQKLADDEPLGGGRTPANKAFEAFEEAGAGKSADSIFG